MRKLNNNKSTIEKLLKRSTVIKMGVVSALILSAPDFSTKADMIQNNMDDIEVEQMLKAINNISDPFDAMGWKYTPNLEGEESSEVPMVSSKSFLKRKINKPQPKLKPNVGKF